MAIVDPRSIYSRLYSAAIPQSAPQNASMVPDTDPTGHVQDPSGGSTGLPAGGGDFWNQMLAKLKPYASEKGYNTLLSNQSQLSGLVGAAQNAFGGPDSILKYLDYNPLKGLYTMLSYINNTPYYDKSGDGSYKPFYVPGFDYDPNTPGVQGPSWTGTPYAEGMHAYRT